VLKVTIELGKKKATKEVARLNNEADMCPVFIDLLSVSISF